MTTYAFYHIHKLSQTAWCGACHERLPDWCRWGDACPFCDARLEAISVGCVRTCQHCHALFVADEAEPPKHCSTGCFDAWNRYPVFKKKKGNTDDASFAVSRGNVG